MGANQNGKQRRKWMHNRFDGGLLLQEVSKNERVFLTESTGRSFDTNTYKYEVNFYTKFLATEFRKFPGRLLNDCLTKPDLSSTEIVFELYALVAKSLKADLSVTADALVDKAIEENVFMRECNQEGNAQEAARQIIIAAVGAITMFYCIQFSELDELQNQFGAHAEQTRVMPARLHSEQAAPRPVLEVLNLFQDLLPSKSEGRLKAFSQVPYGAAGNLPALDALTVSCLNAATLCELGSINIHWVKCISSHLDFDPVNRRLNLFCVPSFAILNASEEAVFSRTLNDYYKGRSCPEAFTTGGFVQEILLSYKLIFAEDSKARAIWQKCEKQKATAAAGGLCDPMLSRLCGESASLRSYGLRQSYSADEDFPIYGERLRVLQNDILRIHPNRLSGLFHDRRDMLRWYTFFAVLGIGISELILSILQTVLSGIQISYTIMAHRKAPS